MKELRVIVPIRPRSLNAERAGNRFGRAEKVAEEREIAFLATLNAMGKHWVRFHRVTIDVFPSAINRRYRQDIANCVPSAKSCIDGLVDAGVIDDDDDTHVTAITFHPHTYGSDALVLIVKEAA